MHIRITKSFADSSSPRPFAVNELLDVPEAVAQRWIDAGNAQEFHLSQSAAPPKRKREKAVRS